MFFLQALSRFFPENPSRMLYDETGLLFSPRLLRALMNKSNRNVRKIFEKYQPNDSLPSPFYSAIDKHQWTLLHHATKCGNEEIVKLLIDCGSDVNAENEDGITPIVLAAMADHEEIVEMLLDANADIQAVNSQGKSTLQMIFGYRQKMKTSIIRMLLKELNLQNIIETDVAKYICECNFTLYEISSIKNVELMKYLLDQKHYKVNRKDLENGKTALHGAVQMNDLQIVKMLVEYGANVDALDSDKATPLYYLYPHEKDDHSAIKILKLLVNYGASLTLRTNRYDMQVSRVLVYGCKKAVKLVLQYIDDLSISDKLGRSVIHLVSVNQNEDVIEKIRNYNFNINLRNKHGDTPLQLAAEVNLPDNVDFLLKHGANVYTRDNYGNTPLYGLYKSLNFNTELDDIKQCARLLFQYDFYPSVDDLHAIINRVLEVYIKMETRRQLHWYQPEEILNEPEEILTSLEPIIEHLALIKSREIEPTNYIFSKIAQQPSWVKYIEIRDKEVKQMMTTTFYGNVTLFEFSIANQKKRNNYVHNEELVFELKNIIRKIELDSPYRGLLRNRLKNAIWFAEQQEKAINAICRLVGSECVLPYSIVKEIVEYLGIDDMKKLDRIMTE